ncbi:MAG: AMP-binding protein, partial [Planctomycetota bacterium]
PDKFRRRVTVYVGEPVPHDTPIELIRSRVHQLSARAEKDNRNEYPTMARAIIRAWRKRSGKLQVADSTGASLKGREALTKALALRRCLSREVFSRDEKNIGVLLPPSVGGVLTNVALALDRRVTANLNYTVSSDVINHCIEEAEIKHVLTSEKFLSKIDLEINSDVVTLESLRDKVSMSDKLVAFLQAYLVPAFLLDRILGLNRIQPDDLLTMIFTSGSTGMPKGVMLSQANVSHNVTAIDKVVRLNEQDVILGVLPFFHSFGYSVTLWAAQTLGPCGVYHFNPLDARQVGKLAEKYGATVLLGTPTFLRGYIRRIQPEQFSKLDVVVVGAEKMPADLFESFEKRFGVRPIEGYGTTELSPLVSVNVPPSRSPAKFQPDRIEGSVGRPVPGVCAKVVSPDTGEELPAGEDGMLLIAGPNIMLGYAKKPELTSKAVRDGWYETGDIAHVDEQGFVHITGRLSRFSKIGGEMVPHVTVEEAISRSLGESESREDEAAANDEEDDVVQICVTATPDPKKGERLIVLHRAIAKDVEQIIKDLREEGLPNLFIPARDAFFEVEKIPVLGTGKLDLRGAKDLALQLTEQD